MHTRMPIKYPKHLGVYHVLAIYHVQIPTKDSDTRRVTVKFHPVSMGGTSNWTTPFPNHRFAAATFSGVVECVATQNETQRQMNHALQQLNHRCTQINHKDVNEKETKRCTTKQQQ